MMPINSVCTLWPLLHIISDGMKRNDIVLPTFVMLNSSTPMSTWEIHLALSSPHSLIGIYVPNLCTYNTLIQVHITSYANYVAWKQLLDPRLALLRLLLMILTYANILCVITLAAWTTALDDGPSPGSIYAAFAEQYNPPTKSASYIHVCTTWHTKMPLTLKRCAHVCCICTSLYMYIYVHHVCTQTQSRNQFFMYQLLGLLNYASYMWMKSLVLLLMM